MKASPLFLVCGGLAGLAVLTAGTAELVGRCWGESLRAQIYAGGLAGMLLGLAGLPFAAKLARLKDAGVSFWRWWGGGILARLLLLLVLAVVLGLLFPAGPAAALLSMGVVYLIGIFTEAAWLARRLFAAPAAAQEAGRL